MRFFTFLAIVLLICVSVNIESFASPDDDFFSHKRFFLNQTVAGKFSGNGRINKDLKIFTVDFTKGISAISAGQLDEAEKLLLNARKVWPEYFYTDFVIALIYEKKEDYKTAAQYYKSYLKKLKDFYKGRYGISGPLILSFTSGNIESYESAYPLVEEHLARFNIDLNKVKEPSAFSGYIFPFFIFVFFAAMYIAGRYWLVPYVKKWRRIMNPPEGFWVCTRCTNTNPDPLKECGKCGKPRGND